MRLWITYESLAATNLADSMFPREAVDNASLIWHTIDTPLDAAADCRATSAPYCNHHVPFLGAYDAYLVVDGRANQQAHKLPPPPPRQTALSFSMESHVMRNRLRVSFWGVSLSAEGIVAIVAALLIIFAVLAVSRF